MTSVTFFLKGHDFLGFEVSGHSGYAPEGEDIVCAGITSAVRLVECAITDVLHLSPLLCAREREGFISLRLPPPARREVALVCQTLLAAFRLHVMALSNEYPDYITVLEVQQCFK